MMEYQYYASMAPMKYYQPLDYKNQKAQDMIENRDDLYIASEKHDGEWSRIIKCGETIIIQSRNISKVTGTYGDKTELVPHIVEEIRSLPFDVVLLGELCFTDRTKTSKDVGSILRCLPAKAIARQKDEANKLNFIAFDCLYFDDTALEDAPYETRMDMALQALASIPHPHYCSFTTFQTYGSFANMLQNILVNGGEGIVIERKDAVYAPGKRPAWQTLKVKKITQEIELPVVSTVAPRRDYEGKEVENWSYWMGTYADGRIIYLNHVPGSGDVEDGLTWIPVTKPYYMGWQNGIVVKNKDTSITVTSGLTDDDRAWLSTKEAQTAIKNGEVVAVCSCMEIMDSGSMRHPRLVRLRTDA